MQQTKHGPYIRASLARLILIAVVGVSSGFAAPAVALSTRDEQLQNATQIRKIVASDYNACALTQAGAVYCWGTSVLGLGAQYGLQPRLVPGAVSGVADIALGNAHGCLLTSGGAVKCWGGANSDGQLGYGRVESFSDGTLKDVIGLSSGVVAIGAGGNTSCAVKGDGLAYCWGGNRSGQLGIGNTQNMSVPVTVTGALSNVVGISTAGVFNGHTCALTGAGTAWCWGANGFGQLGNGANTNRTAPVQVSALSGVSALAVAEFGTCALVGGGVKCWGARLGASGSDNVPADVSGLGSGVGQLALSSGHACVGMSAGGVQCLGYNGMGQLGNGSFNDSATPVSVPGLGGVTAVAVGQSGLFEGFSCAVANGTEIVCWGDNMYGRLGNGTPTYRTKPAEVVGLSGALDIGLGEQHTCAVVNPGTVKCWGGNDFGALGDGAARYELTPRTVSLVNPPLSLDGSTAIASNAFKNCVLRPTAITCWGSSPPVLSSLTSIPSQISVAGHSCAVFGGGIKCIGFNSDGQLGNGSTTTNNTTWSDVIGLGSGVAKVATGGFSTCALLTSGAVKCWGNNSHGQLGDGTNTDRSTPVDVSGISAGAVDIAVGIRHACAALSDGGVKCWGDNGEGQLGVEPAGFQQSRNTPAIVTGVGGVVKAAAGSYHTCALTGGGAVTCWGNNNAGELGIGFASNYEKPAGVVGLSSGANAIVASRADLFGDHTCAIMGGGAVRCWGFNRWGQTGDRHTGFALAPVRVLLNGVGTEGGLLTPTDGNGNVNFLFAGNTFTAPITLSYSVPGSVPPLGALRGVNRVFDVTPVFADTGLPATPSGRYTVTVTYAEADLGGAAEGTLGLYFWDGGQWVYEPSSSVSAAANTVSASPNHFSIWAVLSNPQAPTSRNVYLPLTVR